MIPRASGRRGFALVTVIWGVAIIALLVVSFMTTARLQLQTAYNLAGATKADYAADALLNDALMALIAERETKGVAPALQPQHDGTPRFCALDGVAVAVAVEDETGKLDLNGASRDMLRAMIVGFGMDRRDADAVAGSIVAFHSLEESAAGEFEGGGRPFPPKHQPFQSVLELDQVEGMTPQLFAAILPFVTINSRGPGVDRRVAPPALFAALAGYPLEQVEALRQRPYPNNLDRNDPRFPREFERTGARGATLAHVEAMLPSGQTSVREAVFDLNDARGPSFALKERRRGGARYLDDLRLAIRGGGVGVPEC